MLCINQSLNRKTIVMFQIIGIGIFLLFYTIQAASSDVLCGPDAYASNYVETEFYDYDRFSYLTDRSARLESIPKGDFEASSSSIVLQRYADDGSVVSKTNFQVKDESWHLIGSFPSGTLLVLVFGDDRSHLRTIKPDNQLGWTADISSLVQLSTGDEAILVHDDTLFLMGRNLNENNGALIVEVKENTGVISTVQLGSDVNAWPNHITKLKNGYYAITIVSRVVRDDVPYSSAKITLLDAYKTILWVKTFTNGFDDRLQQITELPNGNLLAAGTSYRKDRYERGNEAFWLVEVNPSGNLVDQDFLYEPDGAVISGSEKFHRDGSGNLLVDWGVQGKNMNDAQHQNCTYQVN